MYLLHNSFNFRIRIKRAKAAAAAKGIFIAKGRFIVSETVYRTDYSISSRKIFTRRSEGKGAQITFAPSSSLLFSNSTRNLETVKAARWLLAPNEKQRAAHKELKIAKKGNTGWGWGWKTEGMKRSGNEIKNFLFIPMSKNKVWSMVSRGEEYA